MNQKTKEQEKESTRAQEAKLWYKHYTLYNAIIL